MKDLNWEALGIVLLKAGNILMLLYALYSVVMAFREDKNPEEGEDTISLGPLFPAIELGLACILTVIGLLPLEDWLWVSCFFSILGLWTVCFTANRRLKWDAEGFWYRSAFRKSVRYVFSDIKKAIVVRDPPSRHTSSTLGLVANEHLVMRVKNRRIGWSSVFYWEPFLHAYDVWRRQHGLNSVRMEQDEQWKKRYFRHGSFMRKLDRVQHGRYFLVLYLIIGAVFCATAIYGLWIGRSRGLILLIALGLAVPLFYCVGVGTLNRKIIKSFTGSAKIRPAPDEAPKQYRKKK